MRNLGFILMIVALLLFFFVVITFPFYLEKKSLYTFLSAVSATLGLVGAILSVKGEE